MGTLNRRTFLQSSAAATGALFLPSCSSLHTEDVNAAPRFGLVTYLWGQHWDLPTLIANCEASDVLGVELRTTHKHGVEPSLTASERLEVRRRFEKSRVTLVGLGSNEAFHHADQRAVRRAVATTRTFLQLSADVGGSGVKVKPNGFPKDVPRKKTIAQIGSALRELGDYAATLEQEVRVEVHGTGTQQIPVMQAIMKAADHKRVRVCWNCNMQDLDGEGLLSNFHLVRPYFGGTVHVRELNVGSYPYERLMPLFTRTNYNGWVLLEARRMPAKPVQALIEQRLLFQKLLKP